MNEHRITVRSGFTLIELLVVIAIIAILAAILFPVFAQAKSAAKRTQDVSNVKNITLGVLLYTGDYDDSLPPTRQVIQSSDWWGPRTIVWKDSVYPYIKSGGRSAASGTFYGKPGDGGIFQAPLNQATWSNADRWFGSEPGDETTRFPRGYAANKDAGRNEFGGPRADGRCADTIWPEIYPNGSGGWDVYNQGGNQGMLQSPSSTAMIAPTRKMFPDIEVSNMALPSTPAGQELTWASNAYPATHSLVAGTQNRGVTLGMFDGSAKNVNAMRSVADDLWGSLGPGGIPACGWNAWWSGPGNGKPWKAGILANMNVIKEWSN